MERETLTQMMKDCKDAPWGNQGSFYYRVSHMMDGMVSYKLCEELANYSLCVKIASARENCHGGLSKHY